MATNEDDVLQENVINDVESDELLQQMLEDGQLEEHQLYCTPSSLSRSNTSTQIIWEVWE